MILSCPKCHKRFNAESHSHKECRTVRCPTCTHSFTAPTSTENNSEEEALATRRMKPAMLFALAHESEVVGRSNPRMGSQVNQEAPIIPVDDLTLNDGSVGSSWAEKIALPTELMGPSLDLPFVAPRSSAFLDPGEASSSQDLAQVEALEKDFFGYDSPDKVASYTSEKTSEGSLPLWIGDEEPLSGVESYSTPPNGESLSWIVETSLPVGEVEGRLKPEDTTAFHHLTSSPVAVFATDALDWPSSTLSELWPTPSDAPKTYDATDRLPREIFGHDETSELSPEEWSGSASGILETTVRGHSADVEAWAVDDSKDEGIKVWQPETLELEETRASSEKRTLLEKKASAERQSKIKAGSEGKSRPWWPTLLGLMFGALSIPYYGLGIHLPAPIVQMTTRFAPELSPRKFGVLSGIRSESLVAFPYQTQGTPVIVIRGKAVNYSQETYQDVNAVVVILNGSREVVRVYEQIDELSSSAKVFEDTGSRPTPEPKRSRHEYGPEMKQPFLAVVAAPKIHPDQLQVRVEFTGTVVH